MAAVVTAPPILIDPVGYSRQSNAEINPCFFPYSISNLYTGLARNIPVSPQLSTAVNSFKSTDAAATWAIQDVANSPGRRDSWWSERNGIIRVALIDGLANIRVTAFDTATNTWGTTSPAFTLPDFPKNEGAVLVDKPNGDVVYFWIDQTTNALNCGVLNSGVWSGVTTLLSLGSNGSFLIGGAMDSTGAVHLVKGRGSDNTLSYIRVSNSLVAGSVIDIGSEDGLRAGIRIFGDNIAIATSAFDNTVNVAIGTPLGAPSFTNYVVFTATGTQVPSYPDVAIGLNGSLYAYWVVTDYGIPSPYMDQIQQSTFDGASSWSSPILFYDAVTNPPANNVAPIDQFIHTMQMPDQFPNGQWVPYIGLEVLIVPGGGEACAGFMAASPATTPTTPTGTCPIGGGTATVGIPYSKMLLASGGTPPYTWEIIG